MKLGKGALLSLGVLSQNTGFDLLRRSPDNGAASLLEWLQKCGQLVHAEPKMPGWPQQAAQEDMKSVRDVGPTRADTQRKVGGHSR